jgi:hypothetical protein
MLEPNDIQAEILASDPKRFLMGAGVGVGKTVLSLMLAEGRILVVSPKTNRIDGNFERDAKLLGMEPPLHISKEDFKKKEPEACDTLILDEAEFSFGTSPNTYRKGGFEHIKSSGIHNALYTYIQKHQPKRIYLLSATPVEKSMQAWSAARLLGVLTLDEFESFQSFRGYTHTSRPRGYSILWMEKKTKKSKEIIRSFLRSFGYFGDMERAKPNLIPIYVELTEEQKQKIVATGEKYPEKKSTDDSSAVDENSAVRNNIKYGIECGVFTEYLFDDDKHTQKKITTVIPNNYLPEVLTIVQKEQNPIVFAHYIKQIELIKEYLQEHTNMKIVVITGKVKEADKVEALRAIAEDPDTILIAQSAMSAGWQTLISSATIFASVTRWRHYHQGMGRNSRFQNKDEVKNVYRLYLGPKSQEIWDERIDHRKDFNSSLQRK